MLCRSACYYCLVWLALELRVPHLLVYLVCHFGTHSGLFHLNGSVQEPVNRDYHFFRPDSFLVSMHNYLSIYIEFWAILCVCEGDLRA